MNSLTWILLQNIYPKYWWGVLYQTTRRHVSDHIKLYSYHCDNLKSLTVLYKIWQHIIIKKCIHFLIITSDYNLMKFDKVTSFACIWTFRRDLLSPSSRSKWLFGLIKVSKYKQIGHVYRHLSTYIYIVTLPTSTLKKEADFSSKSLCPVTKTHRVVTTPSIPCMSIHSFVIFIAKFIVWIWIWIPVNVRKNYQSDYNLFPLIQHVS